MDNLFEAPDDIDDDDIPPPTHNPELPLPLPLPQPQLLLSGAFFAASNKICVTASRSCDKNGSASVLPEPERISTMTAAHCKAAGVPGLLD